MCHNNIPAHIKKPIKYSTLDDLAVELPPRDGKLFATSKCEEMPVFCLRMYVCVAPATSVSQDAASN